jgi:hypothetical protein
MLVLRTIAPVRTFRAWTQLETSARELDWLNTGIFIVVGRRRAGVVASETYLVG